MTVDGKQAAPRPKRMGYQPGLDGIRTFSVGLVAVHHAEIVQMEVVGNHHELLVGGFVYPEMFFVMSGFLITTLMLQEREGTGNFRVGAFYGRRARRLLPGLWAMMLAVTVWATFWGNVTVGGVDVGNAGLSGLKESVLPTFFMSTNWWMIISGNGYFGSFPNLLRHIWSLSIDEQFYLLWPVLLWLGLRGRRFDPKVLLKIIVPIAIAGWILMAVVYRTPANGDSAHLNFAYLSTFTRIPGIFVGCALACVWRPWTWKGISDRHLRGLDVAGLGAFATILLISVTVHNESAVPYRGLFPVVSVLAAVVAGVVVHPGAHYTRAFFGNKVVSGIGKRAFGMYLWHWPILAGPLAETSFSTKVLLGVPLTAVFAEASYRFIEGPFRERRVDGWLRKVRELPQHLRRPKVLWPGVASVSVLFLALVAGARLVTLDHVDITEDKREVTVDLGKVTGQADGSDTSGATTTAAGAAGGTGSVDGAGTSTDTAVAQPTLPPGTTVPSTPMKVAVVGGSQADVFAKNLPDGIGSVFDVWGDGKAGCSVFDDGAVVTTRKGFGWSFDVCKGWQQSWVKAAKAGGQADVIMVMTGGWDVFSLRMDDGSVLEFATPQWDALWKQQMQSGVDALLATGARVALLEAPCQRPIETPAAGVPPLPERRDDARTHHVADLMQQVAAANPGKVYYLDGPDEWCNDPAIGENPAYRYDGVHVLKPGAKLIIEKVGPQLLSIPRRGT